MDKILVTGASGFIGQALVKALAPFYDLHLTYESIRDQGKNPEVPPERKYVMPLDDPYAIDDVVREVKPHFVIHLAAKTEVAFSFQDYHDTSIVDYVGTVDLAEANRRLNPNLQCFIMASTMETYGARDEREPFDESTPQSPAAPYAVAKLACEHYLRYMAYAYEFPFTALRLTNVYGRHDNDYFIVERIITQMLRGDVCNLGDPDPERNFLFIDDLVALFTRLLEVAKTDLGRVNGEFFVTGPDNALSIRDLADLIKAKLVWTGAVNWRTIPARPGEIFYLNSIATKAREVLGWSPTTSLDEGLDKTIEMWRGR